MLGVSLVNPYYPKWSFSVKTLTGVTPSWKTELNRSITTVEDGIPRGLQYHHKTCYEKGGCHRRWACIIWRWFYHGDIISRQVNLYMTTLQIIWMVCNAFWSYKYSYSLSVIHEQYFLWPFECLYHNLSGWYTYLLKWHVQTLLACKRSTQASL